MKDYKVGQILFLTANQSLRIVPAQVVEEVIRTTIAGKEKTYMIQFPNEEKTIQDIRKVKGSIFTTRREVRNFMINNATIAIDKMIQNALKISNNSFEIHEQQVANSDDNGLMEDDHNEIKEATNEFVQQDNESDIISVDLGNGTLAKMNVKDLEKVGLN
jgi:hypothetical protein